MNSRVLLFGALFITAYFAPLKMAAKPRKNRKSDSPNVIYIYADDMGKGMMSVYGQKHFTTPNLDMLVKRGVSFENAYGCMLSAPARASLLTGYHDCHPRGQNWMISNSTTYIHPQNDTTIIKGKELAIDNVDVYLKDDDLYLPQIFEKAGYVTAQIGKLEWGFIATRKQMHNHGWQYYYGYLDHVRCHGFYPPFLFDNGAIDIIEGNTLPNCGKSLENETEYTYAERHNMNGKKVYSQDIFMQKIISFLRENKDNRFFLYHPTQLPHGPVSVPKVYPEIEADSSLTPIEKEYASMIKMLDENVGQIIEELKALGIAENTMIIFASDNGHEIYYSQKGCAEKPYRNLVTGEYFNDITNKYYSDKSGDVFNGNMSMAGLKRSNLDGGAHIPLTFYMPSRLNEGEVRKDVVANYELAETMAEMLKIKLAVNKDGESFWRILTKGDDRPDDSYVVYGSNLGPAIVRNDGWKLRYIKSKDIFELYNLRKDPQERENVIDENREIAKMLEAILRKECHDDLSNGINIYG